MADRVALSISRDRERRPVRRNRASWRASRPSARPARFYTDFCLTPIPGDGALTHWGVDDVAAAVQEAIAAGAQEHAPVSDVGDGIMTATVRISHGAILGLIFNPHFQLP